MPFISKAAKSIQTETVFNNGIGQTPFLMDSIFSEEKPLCEMPTMDQSPTLHRANPHPCHSNPEVILLKDDISVCQKSQIQRCPCHICGIMPIKSMI